MIALFLATLGTTVPRASGDSFPIRPCEIASVTARCGTYWVYENRATGKGRRIPLKVIVLPARNGAPLPDPVLFVSPGGPGTTNSETALATAMASPLRDRREIILVDLRGTNGSNRLDCDGPPPKDLQTALASLFDPAVIRDCRNKLERVADLALYTTPLIVDDLDDVRAALGFSKVNLLGMSWGTRAVLVYLRRHPAAVRTAIVEGVVPPSYKYPLPGARASQHVLERLFAECDSQPACASAFPRLRDDVAHIVAQLRQHSVTVRANDPYAHDTTTITLDAAEFGDGLRSALYARQRQARLPRELHEAASGDFRELVEDIGAASGRGHGVVRLGFLLSVSCSEDGSRITNADVARETRDTFAGDTRIRQQLAACKMWRYAKPSSSDAFPVRSNAPVFLLSGLEDPATQPESGADAVQYLPNGIHVVAHGGHVPNGPCIDRMIQAFVDAASRASVDTSCLSDIRPPVFEVGPPTVKSP